MAISTSPSFIDGTGLTNVMEQPRLPKWAKVTFLGLGVFLVFYGFLSADMGRILLDKGLSVEQSARVVELIGQAQVDPSSVENAELRESTGAWIWLISKVTSDDYIYEGAKAPSATLTIYMRNPDLLKVMLGIHMSMGLFLMVLAPFMFWPPARKKWPAIHKKIGYAYVGSIFVSLVSAGIYLWGTDPYHGLFGPLFYEGNVFLLSVTAISISLAVFFAIKHDAARHQAFMVLAFLGIVSAPLSRGLWFVIGSIFHDDITFRQVQSTTDFTMFLLPGTVCYLIYCMVRSYQLPRNRLAPSPAWTQKVGMAVSVLAIFMSYFFVKGMIFAFDHFLGMNWGFTEGTYYPAALLAREQIVLSENPALVFATLTSLAFSVVVALGIVIELSNKPLLTRFTKMSFVRASPFVFALAGLLTFCFGYSIGLPTDEIVSGGSLFTNFGVWVVLLSVAAFVLNRQSKEFVAKEVSLTLAGFYVFYVEYG